MPYRPINSKEVAKMLGMDSRRVEKLAQRGEIPCQRVGGQYRFIRAEISQWLQQHMPKLPEEHLADMDAGISAHRETNPSDLIISPMLQAATIAVHLHARTRHSVLREMVRLAVEAGLAYDGDELLGALEQREDLCSTAMEKGLAIPHPPHPMPYNLAEPILIVAQTSNGIGYGAPDGKLTDLFFLTASQDDRHHLHVLARICRMLNDDTFLQELRLAETADDIIKLLQDREQAVLG